MKTDVIVVGAGAMGAATTWQLASRGVGVVAIDRFVPPHAYGSSHGDTRITRELFNNGPELDLARRSHAIWRELETLTGETLLTINGGLFIGNGASGDASWISRLARTAHDRGIAHEQLTSAQLRERFPTFAVNDEETALFEPGAGFLNPERCIATQLDMARNAGAIIRTDETVTKIEPTGDDVRVHTTSDVHTASQVVVTTGTRIAQHMPSGLARHIQTYRQVLHWFDIKSDWEQFRPSAFPVFVWQASDNDHDMFYGFPAVNGPTGGLKVATEQHEVPCDPGSVDQNVPTEETDRMFQQFGQKIRGLGHHSIRTATCVYAITSDRQYIIDRSPESERIHFVSACMGRGFKHSAALGEAIAQTLISGSSDIDITQYAIGERFGNVGQL